MPSTDWLVPLPSAWAGRVLAPLAFERFRDFEMAAEHIRGIDEDGAVCFIVYRWVEHDLRSDDDEDYYQMAVRGLSLKAWRLRDGRWLSHRLSVGEGESARSLFTLGDAQPTLARPG